MSPTNSAPKFPDVWVEVKDTIVLFRPLSYAANQRVKKNVKKSMWRGAKLAVEKDKAGEFADLLIAQGFKLQGPGRWNPLA